MSTPYYFSQRNRYFVTANWGADSLEPSAIAACVLNTLDRTRHLVPPGHRWFILDRSRERWVVVTELLADIIEANRIPGDFGEPDPPWGYSAPMFTLRCEQDSPSSGSLHISLTAGSRSLNHLDFEIGDISLAPNYSRLSYPVYREMMGAIAEAWPCPWILACNSRSPNVHPPADLAVNGPLEPPFGGVWIMYLSARLAEGLTPPAELVAELTTAGGVFLSTTRTLLDQSNTDEMRRSRMLEKVAQARIGYGRGGGLPYSAVRVGPA